MESTLDKFARCLACLGVIVSLFAYSPVCELGSLASTMKLGPLMYVYYLGLFLLVLSVMMYAIGDVKSSVLLFGVSLLVTSLSGLSAKVASELSWCYFGALAAYVALGLAIALTLFISRRELGILAVGVLYASALVLSSLYGASGVFSLAALFTRHRFVPHIMLMGGVFSVGVAAGLIVWAVLSMSHAPRSVLIRLEFVILMTVLLGILYEMFYVGVVLVMELAEMVMGAPEVVERVRGFLGVLQLMGFVITPLGIIGAMFYAALVYHAVTEFFRLRRVTEHLHVVRSAGTE